MTEIDKLIKSVYNNEIGLIDLLNFRGKYGQQSLIDNFIDVDLKYIPLIDFTRSFMDVTQLKLETDLLKKLTNDRKMDVIKFILCSEFTNQDKSTMDVIFNGQLIYRFSCIDGEITFTLFNLKDQILIRLLSRYCKLCIDVINFYNDVYTKFISKIDDFYYLFCFAMIIDNNIYASPGKEFSIRLLYNYLTITKLNELFIKNDLIHESLISAPFIRIDGENDDIISGYDDYNVSLVECKIIKFFISDREYRLIYFSSDTSNLKTGFITNKKFDGKYKIII